MKEKEHPKFIQQTPPEVNLVAEANLPVQPEIKELLKDIRSQKPQSARIQLRSSRTVGSNW